MNRKLHNTLMALSTTGLLLVVGLMAATPVAPSDAIGDTAFADAATQKPATRTSALEREIGRRAAAAVEARAEIFETEFRSAASADEAIALTAAFVARTAAEAALAAAFAPAQAEEREATAPADAPRKRRSARSTLALPYFSFARGLRGGTGG